MELFGGEDDLARVQHQVPDDLIDGFENSDVAILWFGAFGESIERQLFDNLRRLRHSRFEET